MDAAPDQQRETFASYLVKYYIATKGYKLEVLPEATLLKNACDYVLTGMNGLSLEMICIIDCEAHPGKQFELSQDQVGEIGSICLKYSGTMNRIHMPVFMRVYEIGPGIDVAERRTRLTSLRRNFGRAQITGWIFDTSAKSIWTTAHWKGRFHSRRELERLLRDDRISDTELRASTVAGPAAETPIVTSALLAILTAIFACEIFFALDTDKNQFDLGIATLIAMGGSSWLLTVQQGEWYRGISAVFLHGDVIHFLINAVVLFWAGRRLGPLIGHAWFGAIYAVAAVCGSLLSLAVNPINMVSVGASGAIMGLMAAAFVCSLRFPHGPLRTHLQILSLQVLIPSMLPLAPAVGGAQVDFAAHIGGAIGGALVGALMLRVWSREASLPSLRATAAATAAIWAAGAIYAGAVLGPAYATAHREQALHAFLIPEKDLPRDIVAASQADSLATKYPRDPRAHYFRAVIFMKQSNWSQAENELKIALGEKEILTLLLPESFHDDLQGLLALTLSEQGRNAEAKAVAKPVCTRFDAGAARETFIRLCS
jgi:rhomboid protease GluP